MQQPTIGQHTGLFNFGNPNPNLNLNSNPNMNLNSNINIMTMEQFGEHVKQAFEQPPPAISLFNQQSDQQTQPTLPPPAISLFNQQQQQQQQPTQPQQAKPIVPACLGAYGPKPFDLGNSMTNLKKEKDNKEAIALLYAELSSIRTQIETLTKATDNIYKIINKFNF